ncbi:MAG: hypothetical protein U0174_07600 [Polyangiaceae bacterium]
MPDHKAKVALGCLFGAMMSVGAAACILNPQPLPPEAASSEDDPTKRTDAATGTPPFSSDASVPRDGSASIDASDSPDASDASLEAGDASFDASDAGDAKAD